MSHVSSDEASALAPPTEAASRPVLFAPTVDTVSIIVDGSAAGIGCHHDEERPGWWQADESLPDGAHYRFRLHSRSWFAEGEPVEVVDPEARQVDHLGNGHWSVVGDTGLAAYRWRHDDKPLPDRTSMCIYELYVQDFNDGDGGGDFASVVGRLDYLADLGVTTVELLPVSHPGNDAGWGYTPRFLFAVAPRFGQVADLAQLVDECHGRSLGVLLDCVYNHADDESPLTRIDHDLWFHHEPRDPDNAWGPQFNFDLHLDEGDVYPARAFIRRHLRQQIVDLHIDGIRVDAVSQIDNNEFLAALRDEAHGLAADKPFSCIAECSPVRPGLVGADGVMDATWHHDFCNCLRGLLVGEWNEAGLAEAIDCRRDGFGSGMDVVQYLSSHDTGHLMRHLLDAGIDEDDALRRCALAYTVLLTGAARPLIWMGDEIGATGAGDENAGPVPWRLLDEDERRQALHGRIRRLLHARREHGALRGDACDIVLLDGERRLLAYHRWDEAGGSFLIVAHPGDDPCPCTIPAPAAGAWRELVDDFTVDTDDAGAVQLELGAWQAMVLRHHSDE